MNVAVVVLPRVPVTPMVCAGGHSEKNNPISISMGTPDRPGGRQVRRVQRHRGIAHDHVDLPEVGLAVLAQHESYGQFRQRLHARA